MTLAKHQFQLFGCKHRQMLVTLTMTAKHQRRQVGRN